MSEGTASAAAERQTNSWRKVEAFPVYIEAEVLAREYQVEPASAPAAMADVDCGRCQGNGEIVTDWNRYLHAQEGDVGDEAVAECPECNGTGRVEYCDWRDEMLGYAYQFIGVIASDMRSPAVKVVLDAFAEPGPDKVAKLPALIAKPRQCPSSPDGRHQVDTSMESGPNNCFHCERPMPGRRMSEGTA